MALRRGLSLFPSLIILLVLAAPAGADGTETLGVPGIPIVPGTAVVGDGTGLFVQPAGLQVDVPAGAAVQQVLLYWNGFHGPAPGASDDTAIVNGMAVAGTLIGGPTLFFGTTYSSTYRADITALGIVADGPSANPITLDGLDFTGNAFSIANGASVVAIVDDHTPLADIQVRDGQDLSYIGFAPPLKSVVPQTFVFPPSLADRTARLTVMAGSVQGPVSGFGPLRPNLFKITLNPGAVSDDRVNLFFSNRGDEWDHHDLDVLVPAGATSMTLQAVSANTSDNRQRPASMTWTTAALALPPAVGCDLDVTKRCDVRTSRSATDCHGKVVSMQLRYTAAGCGALSNPQDGKAICEGGVGPADEPVTVRVTDSRGTRVYADVVGVMIGDVVEVLASNAGAARLENEIRIAIDGETERSRIHTSCSQPLSVGDDFGSVRVVGLTTTEGGSVGGPGRDADGTCTIPAPPPPPHCKGKVAELSLRYLGGDCTASNNTQGGKAQCQGNAAAFAPVRIKAFKNADVFLDTGDPAGVDLGDVVVVAAANAGKNELPGDTFVRIFDEFGNQLQELKIHTSCSQRLDLGDRFGAAEVVALKLVNGTEVGFGAVVDYTYDITNNGPVDVVDVTVIDDRLGELDGSPIDLIEADGGHETLEASAFIDETTRNIVTVTASLASGEECPAIRVSALVRIEEPPIPPDTCDGKIEAMLLTYTGPDLAGPVNVTIVADGFRNDPVVYDLPGGLASGTELSSPGENDFTIDAAAHGAGDLGAKTRIRINGVEEVLHTSCSTPFVAGQPAPLDSPKGDPSPTWFVVRFRD